MQVSCEGRWYDRLVPRCLVAVLGSLIVTWSGPPRGASMAQGLAGLQQGRTEARGAQDLGA